MFHGSIAFDGSLFLCNCWIAIVLFSIFTWIVFLRINRWSIAKRYFVSLLLMIAFLSIPSVVLFESRWGFGWFGGRIQAVESDHISGAKSDANDGRGFESGFVASRFESPSDTALVATTKDFRPEVSEVELRSAVSEKSVPSFKINRWFDSTTWLLIAGLIWAGGSALYFAIFLKRSLSLTKFLSHLELVSDAKEVQALQKAAQDLGANFRIGLYTSKAISVPIAVRLGKARIIFPQTLYSQLTEAQLRAVLLHEIAHLIRHDSRIGLLQEACQIIYWWNPICWRLSKQIDLLRERLCDMQAIRFDGGRALAEALVFLASKGNDRSSKLSCAISTRDNVEELADRIRSLCSDKADPTTRLGMGIRCFAIAFTSLVLLGTSFPLLRIELPIAKGSGTTATSSTSMPDTTTESNTDQKPIETPKSDDEWIEALVQATSHNPVAFDIGPRIASLERARSKAIITAAWPKIQVKEVKTGILKAFQFSHHPDVLYVLDLGMRDTEPYVQQYAGTYLIDWSLRKFDNDRDAYEAWYIKHRDQPIEDVLFDGQQRIVEMCRDVPASEAIPRIMNLEKEIEDRWRAASPANRKALLRSRIGSMVVQWVADENVSEVLRKKSIEFLGEIPLPSEEDVQQVRNWLDPKTPMELRASAAHAILEHDRKVSIDTMLEIIEQITRDEKSKEPPMSLRFGLCMAIASSGEARAIPELIAIMDCDNSSRTHSDIECALTNSKMGELVQVELMPLRDGPWWRRWWEKNRIRMPIEVRDLAIRDIEKTSYGKSYVPLPADLDTHEGRANFLAQELTKAKPRYSGLAWLFSTSRDPRSIPLLIGAIDSDNSYDTVYGIGYYGLGFFKVHDLTQVQYSKYHDGAWWRRWWAENKKRFPTEVQAIEIPDYPKSEHGKSYVPFPDDIDTFEGRIRHVRSEIGNPIAKLSDIDDLLKDFKDPRMVAYLLGVYVSTPAKSSFGSDFGMFLSSFMQKVQGIPGIDLELIGDHRNDTTWLKSWYLENRSKIEGLESVDLPDFTAELEARRKLQNLPIWR